MRIKFIIEPDQDDNYHKATELSQEYDGDLVSTLRFFHNCLQILTFSGIDRIVAQYNNKDVSSDEFL